MSSTLRDCKAVLCAAVLILGAFSWLAVSGMLPSYWWRWQRSRATEMEARRLRIALEKAKVPVAEFSVIHGKGSWIVLKLAGREVRDIRALSGSTIGTLILSNTAVADITPLRSCKISTLSLQGSAVSDISPLEGSSIYSLDLTDTAVTDLTPIAKIQGLKELRVRRTGVSDISPLEGSSLEWLDVRDTAVTNLAPVAKMRDFLAVNLTTAQITQNLDVLRRVNVFVWEGGTNSFSTRSGLLWRYEKGEADASK